MTLVSRVLPAEPFRDLAAYEAAEGGTGLAAARKVDPDTLIAEVEASGLRGRGGGGFPTGAKWRTVAGNRPSDRPSTVVVNGAEGEPGTFKDRAILRASPYAVIEGALIAARAVAADEVVVALKRSFVNEAERLRSVVAELEQAGWTEGVRVSVFTGPGEYLYGEETALLEAIDGRPPFPRVSPPYREGIDEPSEPAAAEMATPVTNASPVLVNNVETLANVPAIIAKGAGWFRQVGTEESPGTIVCTVVGATQRHGVGEVAMGTPLRQVIETIGGGARAGHRVVAVLSGVSAGLLPGDRLDTPLTHEAMAAAGAGLGSTGFTVLDDESDVVAVIAGVSRFLAVESCGQCVPCKRDGLDLSERLDLLSRSEADENDLAMIRKLTSTVSTEARCALARQHETVVASLLERCADAVQAHLAGTAPGVAPAVVAELVDIKGDVAVADEHHAQKQPDWTYDEDDSGRWPAQL